MTVSRITARDLVGDVICRDTSQLLRFHAVARSGVDPEGVHQLRVATRRLRSELDLLSMFIDESWRRRLCNDLGWFASVLGKQRDMDVMVVLLEEYSKSDATLDRSVIGRAMDRREHGHRMVLRALDRKRYRSLLVALTNGALAPPLRHPQDDARSAVLAELRTSWDAVRDASDQDSTDSADFHHLRILTKRARYATEVAEPYLDDAARPIAQRLARVQDELGRLHDDAVAIDFIETWYQSPRAVRGVDPFDARSAWVDAIARSGEHRRDAWRAPLAEAMILIDDASMSWANSERPDSE